MWYFHFVADAIRTGLPLYRCGSQALLCILVMMTACARCCSLVNRCMPGWSNIYAWAIGQTPCALALCCSSTTTTHATSIELPKRNRENSGRVRERERWDKNLFAVFSVSLIILLLWLLMLLLLPRKKTQSTHYLLPSPNVYTQFHRIVSALVHMKYSHNAFLLFKTRQNKTHTQKQQCDLRPIQKSALVC